MAHVLIVDDIADTRDVLGRFLSRAGHQIESAPNGRDALRRILDRTPDAIVLDLQMPEMDGAALLEVLRAYLRLKTLPVIVWTGYPDSPIADRAAKQGVSAILPKDKATFADINRIIGEILPRSA
jgi:CheY-like chemotaxis protein